MHLSQATHSPIAFLQILQVQNENHDRSCMSLILQMEL